MSISVHGLLEPVLPFAVKWAEHGQATILGQGQQLSVAQQNDARFAGVVHPEEVRVLIVNKVPQPEEGLLRTVNDMVQFVGPHTAGLTLGYGIFIRADCADNRKLWAHELVHTAQYERLDGIKNFLQQYLEECLTYGYHQAPLEREAVRVSEKMCSG